MDHKVFIATLPQEGLATLSELSDGPGLRHLAKHLGFVILFSVWIAQGWWFWPLAIVAQGITVCFLFTLVHETTHKTPFRNSGLNEWVGRLAGFVILLPLAWFRYFHLAHHRHTNIPDKDPELLAGAKPETWPAYLIHVSGLPYWVSMVRQVILNAVRGDPADYVPPRAQTRIIQEARWMLAGYALALLSLLISPLLLWIWIIPCLVGQPFLRLYLLAEHGRCAFVANMLENTRTTYTNRIIRFLAWNMPYHIEHHTLPQVPFHKLPKLHDDMKGHHGATANGYLSFTQNYISALHR